MNYSFREAFDGIKAEQQLKDNTYDYIKMEILMRKQTRKFNYKLRFAYTFAICIFMLISGIKGYSIYFDAVSFLSIDINPSIELSLNRFDRVIDSKAYNPDGKLILDNVNIKNKNYDEALEILMKSQILDSYIDNNSYISFTVQSNDSKKEPVILNEVQNYANFISSHHQGIHVECSQVNSEIRQQATDYGISVGKYKAILELQQIDPNVTVDQCRHKSMGELKNYIYEYKNLDIQQNLNPDNQNNPSDNYMQNHRGCHH